MYISRRGFLIGTGATVAGLAVAGATFFGPDSDYVAQLEGEVPETLSAREFVILSHASGALLGITRETEPSLKETRVARRIDRELAFHQGKLKSDIQASLAYLEYSPPLTGKLSRFTSMHETEKVKYLESLRTSADIMERQIYAGLRFMCVFFYYTHPDAWPVMGYPGPQVPPKPFAASNAIENLPPLRPVRTNRSPA